MRIALCHEYWIGHKGGTEVLVSELAKGLSRTHDIILVSADDAASLSASGVAPFIKEHISVTPPCKSVAGATALAGRIAQAKPDIVHFHFGGTYGWGNRLPLHCPIYFLQHSKIPCVSTVHLVVSLFDGYCSPSKPAWFKLLMFPLAWAGKLQQLRCSRREIAVSQHDLRKLRRWYWPCRTRFTQIYHSRLPETSERAIKNRRPTILNVGHITWRKGQEVLAEAFVRIAQDHPQWILQLAGSESGDSADKIRRLAKQNSLEQRIVLLGERSDAFELMEAASIYVQPSYWEALGLALQEALFAGCACIGSRAGGIPELIEDGKNGLLFEPGNVQELATALRQLIENQSRREQLGRAAATSIAERGMTTQRMIQSYLELYETIRRQ